MLLNGRGEQSPSFIASSVYAFDLPQGTPVYGDPEGTDDQEVEKQCTIYAINVKITPEFDFLAVGDTKELTAEVTPSAGGTFNWSTPTDPDSGVRFLVGGQHASEATGQTVTIIGEGPSPYPPGINGSSVSVSYTSSGDDFGRTVQDSDSETCTVFNLSVSGGPSNNKGYIGQKLTYTGSISPSVLHNDYKDDIQWTGGGNPATDTGETFITRIFEAVDDREIKAEVTIGGETDDDKKYVTIKDIFMYGDAGKEYVNIYPNNPNLGAYASQLTSGNNWDTSYIELDENGDPKENIFNSGWVNKYKGDLDSKSNKLRNCKYEGPSNDPVLTTPFDMDGCENLVEFDWKGYWWGIIYEEDYAEHNGEIKLTSCNCHGNSVHSYGSMSLNVANSEIDDNLDNLGASYETTGSLTLSKVVNIVSVGDILCFGTPTFDGAKHSAYVWSIGSTPASSNIYLWACNAGVSSQGTRGGFDVVRLSDYLSENPCSDGNFALISKIK